LSRFSTYRYYFVWKKWLKNELTCIEKELPWMGFKIIGFLRKVLNKQMTVFEYGTGGSTLFFLNHVGKLYSVEHDEQWFDHVKNIINGKDIKKQVTINFIPPQSDNLNQSNSFDNPEYYHSSDRNFLGMSFEKYVKNIEKYPDQYFDLISIDGRARNSCLMHSINKLKKGGHLILDNSDRNHYTKFLHDNESFNQSFSIVLDEWGPTPSLKKFTKTTVWKRK
jgi:predicted O-methyltransferase YrrM